MSEDELRADGVRHQSKIFSDVEPVLQAVKLLKDVRTPCFGEAHMWDLNASPRNANSSPQAHVIRFAAANADWDLRAREIAMAMLNPSHPGLRAVGLFLPNTPNAISTVKKALGAYRRIGRWAVAKGLPDDLSRWRPKDLNRYLKSLNGRDEATHIQALRYLYKYRQVLTGGGLAFEPWAGESAATIAKVMPRQKVTTKPIPPEVWWPLLRAAWTYIDVFSHDLIRARDQWESREDSPASHEPVPDYGQLLSEWLLNPANRVPLHTEEHHASASRLTAGGTGTVHWGILSRMASDGRTRMLFAGNSKKSQARRQQVMAVVQEGRTAPVNLVNPARHIVRSDGTSAPWIIDVSAVQLRNELVQLRTACYIFVAALSMLRDSELQGILRDSIVQHFGSPAIRSRKFKKDRHHSEQKWWIIQPVAQAIAVAEVLSHHPDRVFASSRATDPEKAAIGICNDIKGFIRRVNCTAEARGLQHIPPSKVTPQMFRRSMAIVVRAEPDGELALGLTLKHAVIRGLSNATTAGYGAPDEKWAKELRNELEDQVAAKLVPLWTRFKDGEPVASGVGAKRFVEKLERVNQEYEKSAELRASIGDSRMLRNLLRDEFSNIRLGPLNHCLGVLQDAICTGGLGQNVPAEAIRPNLCQPTLCRNSVVTTDHKPMWLAGMEDLTRQLKDRKMAKPHRAQLEAELADARRVIESEESGADS
jgi:hypothetical protein